MLENERLNKQWARSIMRFVIIFVSIIFLGEVLTAVYKFSNNLVDESTFYYVMHSIVLPTALNFYFIVIAFSLLSIKKINNKFKSMVPIFAMFVICINFLAFHHKSPVSIVCLLLPTVLSIQYSDTKTTKDVALICSFFSILVSGIILLFNFDELTFDLMINSSLSLIFVLGIIYILFCMSKIESEKTKLLVNSLKERNYYRNKSTIDTLTKCNNNAAYRSKMDSNMHKHNNMCLAIIDIDKFKNVNDTYGHANGDVVLKYLGSLLNKMNSDEIFTARYGGEEFTILFYNHTPEQAKKVMEKLKLKFTKHVFPELNNTTCSFSCGIAKELKNDKAVEIFKKADSALYQAKNNGRNQVIVYEVDE